MSTISGTLASIADDEAEIGSIEVALCGYGPQVPRGAGSMFARPTAAQVTPGSDGSFSVEVPGNDVILPSGTYYTITVKNSNGEIVQCNAYLFQDADDYDLDETNPFDPSLPIPPLPAAIVNQLQVLTDQASYVYDGLSWLSFKAVLNQNATIDISDPQPGNLYTFIIVQDGAGGHAVTWSAQIINAAMVNPAANGTTIQTFVCDETGNLYAISAATWWNQ